MNNYTGIPCATVFSVLLASALIMTAAAQPALADGWHNHGDIGHFEGHDYDRWRGGSWFNGDHGGRHGWWWIVDGSWYFYPAPVYPYPDPYTPPAVVGVPAPVTTLGVPPSYAYYCHNPAGYYPYVPQCFGHWHRVVTGTTVVTTQPAPPPTVIVQQPVPQPAGLAQEQAPSPEAVPYPTKPPSGKVGQREADERKLNDFAADFENIDASGQQAHGRLEALEKQVEAFHAALYKRSYNAIEISKNCEDLERRIHEKMDHLGGLPEGLPGAPPPGGLPPPPQ